MTPSVPISFRRRRSHASGCCSSSSRSSAPSSPAAVDAASDASRSPRESAAAVLALALGAYWIVGYRRGRFSLALEPFEAYAVFLILHVAPGDPFLPLLGLIFRSLYGGPLRAFARWALWMAALLGAHAGRGDEQLEADLARAAGRRRSPRSSARPCSSRCAPRRSSSAA